MTKEVRCLLIGDSRIGIVLKQLRIKYSILMVIVVTIIIHQSAAGKNVFSQKPFKPIRSYQKIIRA